MKRSKRFLFLVMVMFFAFIPCREDSAMQEDKLFMIEATAYCETGNPCADGTWPVEGLTVAGKRAWIGKTILIYEDAGGVAGELLMIGEIRDTGGHPKIKAGKCIDIFMDSESEAINFGRQKVWIELVDAVG